MEKTTTLNLRVNPIVKQRAEEVLSMLGMPMSTAIDIYLNQISMHLLIFSLIHFLLFHIFYHNILIEYS